MRQVSMLEELATVVRVFSACFVLPVGSEGTDYIAMARHAVDVGLCGYSYPAIRVSLL